MGNHGKRLDRLEVLWPRPGRVDIRRVAEAVAAETGCDLAEAEEAVRWAVALPPDADEIAALAAELGVSVEDVERVARELG